MEIWMVEPAGAGAWAVVNKDGDEVRSFANKDEAESWLELQQMVSEELGDDHAES